MSRLTEADRLVGHSLSIAMDALPGWSLSPDGLSLKRRLTFEDFVQAFGFMTEVALKAERLDHHPEWTNVWNRVDIALTTHTAGGITSVDIVLANAVDEIASRFVLTCPIDPDEPCGGCR